MESNEQNLTQAQRAQGTKIFQDALAASQAHRPAPCPSCGHCPTCGRSRQGYQLPGYPWRWDGLGNQFYQSPQNQT